MSDAADLCTERVYHAMLDHPEWQETELTARLGLEKDQVRAAIEHLLELNLLRESFDKGRHLCAVDVESGLRAILFREEESARRQRHVARLLLSRLAAPAAAEPPSPGLERLHGMDAIQDRLTALATEIRSEVLTLMPGGAQSAQTLEAARRNDRQILDRGVRIRTVGLDRLKQDPPTLEYARWLTEVGGQFRTVATLPTRVILADGRAALVPIDAANTRAGAVYVTEPGIVSVLTALFEHVWADATPLTEEPDDGDGLSRMERSLLKLLGTGLTDEAAAARLGISQRTARRVMADLMDRLGAQSRFEAGMKSVQRGWLSPTAGAPEVR